MWTAPFMPRVAKIRRRPPSDKRLMRNLSDPGIIRAIGISAVLLGVLGVGVWLVLQGMRH
jgi:hypothetical protein